MSNKLLGFGLMRLPKKGDEIDIEQTKEMVDLFMEAGCTYFDTAWAYPGSEDAMRQALVERYPRDKFTIATKNAAWINCKTREDAIAQFETSLKQTGAGYIDYYLLRNLGESRTRVFDDFDLWNFVKEKKEEGLIKHIGFSFHAGADELDEILKVHADDVEFVQLQINYADWEDHAVQSRACYETVRKYGKPVIVMEPVKGGLLAKPPKTVEEVLKKANPEASCASWAVRFGASLDGVMAVLSGMSNVEQMKDNLSFMEDFQPLTDEELRVIDKAREELRKIPIIPCTTCDYCAKVCPVNIGISGTFSARNLLYQFGDFRFASEQEGWNVAGHGKERADKCIECGACEAACPQHIDIRDRLKEAVVTFKMSA